MKRKTAVTLIPLCMLVLSACGGGGGGTPTSNDSGSGTPTSTGSGTPAANTATSYTIGGTVSGLTGRVVLQNNLSDDYTVSTNGTFTFPTAVTHGDPYSVTVLTQPNGQTCTVSNGSGSATAAISTVAIDCVDKTWGAAALIETDDLGSASAPQIAFDANGNALAVWEQSDGVVYNIMASRYTVAAGWGTPSLIEADDLGDARYPQIAIDAGGNALAVWQQWDGTTNHVWANRYTAGTGWGAAELIETAGGYASAEGPQIAFDASGNALAVWYQWDGSTVYNIMANRYTAGTGWGTAELIETDDFGYAWNPQIAFDANGNALAVWDQSDGVITNIMANRYTAGTGWGTAALVEADAGDAMQPQIAFDANGNALAVWEQSEAGIYSIRANRYTAGTGWGTAASIETDNRGDAGNPQIAIDASGNALAVWQQSDGSRDNIWVNRYDVTTGWGTAALIETADVGPIDAGQQIAIDGDGNALVVWRQTDSPRINVWANRYAAGTGWGTAALIETDDLGDATGPKIDVDANGNALAVWAQHDGTRTNIIANHYP